ncbi:phage baseplate assembly protein V (plasmid) [Agrobacterium salinitolerans]|uniref:Phage baseplate assembly protein V n=1 Tax=Agrobacterium salinitolerans TaxID=1183413 RepID=A0A4Z1QRT3_9HYPH|nr:phage baseplate assembly protein V [Agrobacterium salinitolerans]UYZ11198.1 phage baseplate assembly protein V [Agrobacterium salinitolerans]
MKGLDWLASHIEELGFKVSEIERRERNRRRKGKIAEISDDKSKYRVELSQQDGKPYLTPWIKARTLAAGGVKIDVLYSVGEQVDVVSESGELSDAQIDFSTYSDDNARENSDTPLHIKIGSTVIEATDGLAKVTADKVIVQSDNVQLGGDGGKQVARIGDLVHVMSGSSSGKWPIVEGSGKVFAID